MPICVQTDAGMARLRTGIGVGHKDDLIAKESAQKSNRRRMGNQIGDAAADKLHFGLHLLLVAVIEAKGVQSVGFLLKLGNVRRGQQIRQHEIALYFDLADLFAQGQSGPVAVIQTDAISFAIHASLQSAKAYRT